MGKKFYTHLNHRDAAEHIVRDKLAALMRDRPEEACELMRLISRNEPNISNRLVQALTVIYLEAVFGSIGDESVVNPIIEI